MTWKQARDLGATQLSRILGCPVTTAHSWIRRNPPPEWQQRIYLRILEEESGCPEKVEAEAEAEV